MEAAQLFLPQELVIEILSWVPAECLCRSFKYACKAWFNLVLNDPAFAKLHLHRANATRTKSLVWLSTDATSTSLYQLKPPSLSETHPTQTILFDDFPILLPSGSSLVGSCNGLLCFSCGSSVILVNPSTRSFKISPEQLFFGVSTWIGYGFGYDSSNDDYKVIRFGFGEDLFGWPNDDCLIHVYSTCTNSWKRVHDVPSGLPSQASGLFLNGAIHWLFLCGNSAVGCRSSGAEHCMPTIISFDVKHEEFREMLLPYAYDKKNEYRGLMIVGECLGLICISRRNCGATDSVEVWAMKEYGRRESWIKHYVFVIRVPLREELHYCVEYLFVIGNQILFKGRSLPQLHLRPYLYDMKKRKMDYDFKLKGPDSSIKNAISHIGSLVSFNSTDGTSA